MERLTLGLSKLGTWALTMKALVLGSLVLISAAPASASAQFGIVPGGFDGEVVREDGSAADQAGEHPFAASTTVEFKAEPDPILGVPVPAENVKHVEVDLPKGLVGNPTVVPRCPAELLYVDTRSECADAAQVGVAEVVLADLQVIHAPVYNLVPPPDVPAQFGFAPRPAGNVLLTASVRTNGDYGLSVKVQNISEAISIVRTSLTFWGVPADPAHDEERGYDEGGVAACAASFVDCENPAGVSRQPFLTNPTDCSTGPVRTHVRVESWPGSTDSAFFDSHTPGDPNALIGPTGCENVAFEPSITVESTSAQADSPTGLDVTLTIPQNNNPDGLATAHLEDAVVTFPEGMSVNAASADGLGSCSPAQIGLIEKQPKPRFNLEKPTCPDNSKIGTVEVDTPLLEEPMKGAIYVAKQDDNAFDSLLAIYVVAEGPGIIIKLPGKIDPDPQTGQLETTFLDNPPLPFDEMRLHFKGGARAPLATPPTCGTQEVTSSLTPTSAFPEPPAARVADPAMIAHPSDSFEITHAPNGLPCPASLADRPFDPTMISGVRNPAAGSTTPFTFRLTRPDGHQEILSTEVTPAQGVSAVLKGIPLCGDAAAASGGCPAASKVGRSVIGAGAGSNPYYVQGGEVFLGGPYKGAPLSLAIEVPAVAGPFDLGVVNVRAAIHVDPRTAQLRVVSDPIPQILEGIPLRVRDIRILMDREGFTVAPTNCTEMQVLATVHGSHGATSQEANRFQVGDCGSLDFSPKLRFKATGGKKATKRNGHPGLKAKLKIPGGAYDSDPETRPQANVARVEAVLPKGLLLDQNADALVAPCTRPEYASGQCPEGSAVGSAVAHSPLLDEPLQGPVYLRTSDNPLPDLVADLEGIVDIELVGRIDQKVTGKGRNRTSRIRTTFDIVPDVPVSSFKLKIAGGKGAMLVNENSGKGMCSKARRKINLAIDAHNGLAERSKTKLRAKCGKGKKKRR